MSHPARLRVEPLEDRLTPVTSGTLDPTFGNAGIQRVASGVVSELAVAPDGRILSLVDSGFNLRRFGPNGTPDATFGTGGGVALPGSASFRVLAALADGGAYVGGTYNDPNTPAADYAVVRVTAAGTIDTTFGTNGLAVITTPGGLGEGVTLAAIVVQPDGRVIVAGDQTSDPIITGQPPRYHQGVVARLTAGGQLDSTFGSGGIAVVTDPSGRINSLLAGDVAVQPDGRIVFAGAASATPRGVRSVANQVYNAAAVRLTADGQLDTSFGTGGFTVIGSPQEASGRFEAVSVLSDGRVLLAGQARQTGGSVVGTAARLTPAGALDTTYGASGLAVTTPIEIVLGSGVAAAAIDSSGRVAFSTGSDTVLRLTANGATDTGFGDNGRLTLTSLPGLDGVGAADLDLGRGLAVRPNGDILLGGTDSLTQPSATGGLIVELIGSNPPAGFVPAAAGAITAGGAADGSFQVLTPAGGTYTNAATIAADPGSAASLRATTADVNGDGVADYIAGAGPGGQPRVTILDGETGATLADFPAFEPTFTGGVFVAAADLDGDGRAEVVVTPDRGGGPRVVVYAVQPGGAAVPRASFFGIDDPSFRGGARVAAGDVNEDGTPDLVVAAGFLGGPRVAVFDGTTVGGSPARLVGDFFAFPGADAQSLRNGAFVAAGDVTGDGAADLIFGGGPGGAPRLFVLSGRLVAAGGVAAAQADPVANFFVRGTETDRGGVTVAAVDQAGSDRAAVAAGSGSGAAVRVYRGEDFTTPAEPAAFADVPVFGGAALPGGVFVG